MDDILAAVVDLQSCIKSAPFGFTSATALFKLFEAVMPLAHSTSTHLCDERKHVEAIMGVVRSVSFCVASR